MQNPCHLALHQTSVLTIVVMEKLELREGKGFIQGGTASLASMSCLPRAGLSGASWHQPQEYWSRVPSTYFKD